MQARVAQMLERVGLAAAMMGRYPHEFSGGQCQRIGIARAMILEPKLLICDEPVSSLDVSIQGQIVNLLLDLQRDSGTAMLFISHNLAIVRHLSHRILVMYAGKLVEVAPRDALFAAPIHPYTRALLSAVPSASKPQVARRGAAARGRGRDAAGVRRGLRISRSLRVRRGALRQHRAAARGSCGWALGCLPSFAGIHGMMVFFEP